jgi:hypothetical protein
VNKDIYQIFEAYNTEAVDATAIKKKYDDGLKAITDAGFSPEQMTNAKNVLAQQWQSERQEIGADAGGQDLQELDAIFGTSGTTPPKPTTPAATSPQPPAPPATQPAPSQPTSTTSIPTVNVGRPGPQVTPRPPVAPSPPIQNPSQPTQPPAAQPASVPSNPNVKLRTGTYSDVPVPVTQVPVPGVNVPKPGTVQTPAPAATSPTIVAPAAPATGPEPIRKATATSTTPYIDTTKGRRLTTRR